MAGLWKFFIGGGWKWALGAVVLGLALKFGYEAYTDYQDMIAERIEQAETIAELKTVAATNEATIEAQRVQAAANEINRQVLELNLRLSESRVDDLEGILARHDLEFLALNKPGLIERRINDATDEVFSDLECTTDTDCVRSTE